MDRIRKNYLHQSGFTLIELMVGIGILLILFAFVLIFVDPAERLSRTNDIAAEAITNDFIKSNINYFSQNKKYPWDTNAQCLNEIETGGALSEMPSCTGEIINNVELEDKFNNISQNNDIYARKCGEKVVVCYHPKSKVTFANAKYDKFGVVMPGCPGQGDDCYWCKPLNNKGYCTNQPTPTTINPSPTSQPNNSDDLVPGYAIDESKFFRTYAVYFFEYPGFPSVDGALWNMQISTSPDFSESFPDQINSYGIPSQYSQDAPLNISYEALRNITSKYVGFTSIIPYDYNNNHCGQTIYWRVTNYYSPTAPDKKHGPTYTGVIDCTTKVDAFDTVSWYTVYDMLTYQQKMYDPKWDFDNSGVIDWTDYWLGAFSTKSRSGGWQPPE